MTHSDEQERLEHATSARLARLANRPMDTSHLESRIERSLHDSTEDESTPLSLSWRRWWRPVASIAAVLAIALTIGWLLIDGGTSPAMAAPTELAQIHYDVARGLTPHLKVSTVAEANELLARQADGMVPVPDLPGAMKSCCLHPYAGTTLTCALIEQDGQLITVAVASGKMLHSPEGTAIHRGGRQFTAHAANGINMVMAHEGDRWLCVMGEADTEQLIEIAVDIRM